MLLQSLSLRDVTAHLWTLCEKQSTGTFFIIKAGHLLGQIGLHDGSIVSLVAKNTRGAKGLAEILGNRAGGNTFTVSFAEGTIPSNRMDLPPTAEILATLDGFLPATKSPQPSELRPTLTADAKALLENTLGEFIGPIARMVCADYFPIATTLEGAINALAGEIPSSQAATQFREKVSQRLR